MILALPRWSATVVVVVAVVGEVTADVAVAAAVVGVGRVFERWSE